MPVFTVPIHENNPNHEPAGTSKGGQFARREGVPVEAGTTPIPPGKVRGFHYTDAFDSVMTHGLSVQHAKGASYGEPNAIWFSTARPAHYKNYVEVFLDPAEIALNGPLGRYELKTFTPAQLQQRLDEWNAGDHDFFVSTPHIPATQFVTHHEPWHDRYRYIKKSAQVEAEVVAGEHDDLLDHPEYGPAIRQVKREKAR